MISIGLTGWGDHDSLYTPNLPAREKLREYAGYFPTVEVDSSFYAIQPKQNATKWFNDTPETFKFIVKAYQGMTGHMRGPIPFKNKTEMFQAFIQSLEPYEHKLAMVLFQFPPWFDCKRENVTYLRWCKEQMGETPCALEFRHQSWFTPEMTQKTLDFMKKEGWIHSICDEPQAGLSSIPTILDTLNNENVLVRFHGRNVHGWNKVKGQDWREVRYLYRYNKQELEQWAENLKELNKQCDNVYAVFNNNSGGDAADNAKEMIDLLGIEYDDLAPRQLDLF
ncbi:DUF72 domain-containing protein [Bacillus marasmi]|uniref:DUF72 domain-containing protein n=1 Tax=Bacillus marasmi TaxID=1926279 RepID=UPI0011CB4510|nr:DUF72 domain-containing protein [Bacillus marasmi]